ncbi:uncharacterized protein LOC131079407 isoform X3 [Cryptomeria japonica]|uniref:uncharacterized protein LOC131079407 isoform X3 n=1 Tax=Cryptomeria japonica TaxID=3369 RepID=UPI0027DA1291|nr:uncharacterized protein LOC131079407 isoform X3 [Cryptomeria japonica]
MEGKSECETQEEANSLSLAQALTVPVPILASRFRNKREVELVMEASKFAVNFDDVLEKYEMVSVRAQALKEAWDNLWVSQEALLASAIPLIGEKMSEINRIRAHLLKKMDVIIESLQASNGDPGVRKSSQIKDGLLQGDQARTRATSSSLASTRMAFFDQTSTRATFSNPAFQSEELRMDGIERLAKDKLFLCLRSELEGELGKRINIICTKGSIHKLSGKMADFINSLITKLELCDVTTQNPGCNSLNKTAKTDQDMIPTINSSIQCNEKLMGNDSASTSASKAPHLQENNSGQNVITLAHGLALTSPVIGTCFTSQGLAHNDMNMKIQSHSSLVSEEQLSGIGSKFWLLQNKRST